jgi:hypothetical protein
MWLRLHSKSLHNRFIARSVFEAPGCSDAKAVETFHSIVRREASFIERDRIAIRRLLKAAAPFSRVRRTRPATEPCSPRSGLPLGATE